MITVMDLFSNPIFQEFQLISGHCGLNNEVSGTGIFEWESSDDVDKTFAKGEFVVTTLSQAKNDFLSAENSIKTLILKGVSAIAIKTIFFNEISEELRLFSEHHCVPIFSFRHTYFDDIIYTIKNALISSNLNSEIEEKVIQIINSFENTDFVKGIAKQLNHFFFSNFICCYASLNNKSIKQSKCLEQCNDGIHNSFDSTKIVCSFIKTSKGIIIIYTTKEPATDLYESFVEFLASIQINIETFIIGISNTYSDLGHLGLAIKESIYANGSGQIDNEPMYRFQSTGLDQLLMPIWDDKRTKNYCDAILKKIKAYDEVHNSNLLNTLLEYVKNNGDIKLTAIKSFQHTNTIRYRLNKIKNILNIDKGVDFYPEIFVFARLYQINEILNEPIF